MVDDIEKLTDEELLALYHRESEMINVSNTNQYTAKILINSVK